MAKWTDERVEQLVLFFELLRECSQIDTANNTLARLANIIRLASELYDFQKFIFDDCMAARKSDRAIKASEKQETGHE